MKSDRALRISSLLLAVLLLCSVSASAQVGNASLSGRVTDQSGLALAGAKVEAVNVNTDAIYPTQTNDVGLYDIPVIPPGSYRITVSKDGFQQIIQSGVELHVADSVAINFALAIGSVTQSVTVVGEVPLVNTTTSSLGGLVNDQQMVDLPLNGRNYIQLALLQSGIAEIKDRAISETAVALQGTFFSSDGAPPRSNAYLLDGTSLVTYGGATGASISGSTLGLDGIREFRILTNSFSAEYGMNMGSQMLMVSKGGTNSFHGDAFEFLRNSALDAGNYFDTPATNGTTASGQERRLPPYRRNQFGGAFGGPIKKEKTFFFGVYEGLRDYLGTSNLNGTIPLGCRGAAGATITNAACPELGSTSSVVIAPVIAPWIALFPTPNVGTNKISFGFNQPTVEDYGQMRIDHTFSETDTMFGRYTIDNTTQQLANLYPGYPDSPSSRGQYLTLAENHIFSQVLLNTARFSYSRSNLIVGVLQGVTGAGFSFVPGVPMGSVSVGGVTLNGTPASLQQGGVTTSQGKQNVYAYSDDLFYTRGRHSLKFGTLINHFQDYALNGTGVYGQITFANLATFLAGSPTNWQAIRPGYINYKYVNFDTLGWYVQDDFRATSRLTLNLGLRYEFNTNVVEIHGNQAAIRNIVFDAEPTLGLMTKDPSYLNFSPRLGFAWDIFGDGKTAVRAGFGDLYNIAGWVGIMHQTFRSAPFENQVVVTNPGSFTIPFTFPPASALSTRTGSIFNYDMKQAHLLQYNLAVQQELPLQMSLTVAYAGSRGFNLSTFTEGNPVLPAGVPGVTATGLETCVARPVGQVAPNIGQLNEVYGEANACFLGTESRRNPNWNSLVMLTAGAESWYNSLQVDLDKRISRGLQFQSNFTWARVFDDTQGQSQAEALSTPSLVADPLNPLLDKGPAIFDIPLTWRLNLLYHFPQINSNGFVEKALNGWWVSSIWQFQSGFPFEPTFSTSRSKAMVGGNIAGVDRPDVLPGRNNSNITHGTTAGCLGVPAGQQLGTPTLYFDPCAFTIQPSGFLGNEGRDDLRGPNYQTVDFSLVKDTKVGRLGEAGSIQFRAEVFNLLNRANFELPGASLFAGTGPATGDVETPLAGAGVITAAFPSREIQLALKVIF